MRVGLVKCALLGSLVLPVSWQPAAAQNLANLPGQSDLQRRTGQAVGTVCPGVASAGLSGANPVSDLFARCNELLESANDIAGVKDEDAVNRSLGLSVAETNDALLTIVHDEVAFAGVDAINMMASTFGVLETRLLALREGNTSGFAIAGLPLVDPTGRPLAATERALRDDAAAGSPLDERLGVFVNGLGNWGEFDGTSEEAPFDFDQYGVVAGADYRITDNLSAGAAFTYTSTESDFKGVSSGSDLERDGYTGSLYGTYEIGGFYAQGILSYSGIDYDLDRRIRYPGINRTASGDTEAEEWAGSVGVGYNWSFDAFTVGPYLRTEYIDVEVDGFTESGAFGLNLKYDDTDIRSFTTDLGVAASYAWSTSLGVVSPYVRAEWEHEYENDSRRISARYLADPNNNRFFVRTSSPDRDYANVGGGVTVTTPGGFSAFLDLDTILGLDDVERYLLTAGVRLQF